jgi:hypothetical protein
VILDSTIVAYALLAGSALVWLLATPVTRRAWSAALFPAPRPPEAAPKHGLVGSTASTSGGAGASGGGSASGRSR